MSNWTVAGVQMTCALGDRAANLSAAIAALRNTPGVEVTKVSSFLDNPAVGGPADS